jgi:hypothetical protein
MPLYSQSEISQILVQLNQIVEDVTGLKAEDWKAISQGRINTTTGYTIRYYYCRPKQLADFRLSPGEIVEQLIKRTGYEWTYTSCRFGVKLSIRYSVNKLKLCMTIFGLAVASFCAGKLIYS